jgi:hypothetical protein
VFFTLSSSPPVTFPLDNIAKEIYMRGFGIIVVLVIAAIAGIFGYQLGVSQGLVATGTAVAPAVYYHPFFFGGFGILFPLLFIFLIFGLMRAAFGRGRGWGYGGGWGGMGPGNYQNPRDRIEALHRELHGEKPQDPGTTSPPPSGR